MNVVVLGAGVAGLAAARALSAAGVNVCIIEARNRIGGRIHTVREPLFPLPVELGAEFIHGRPSEIFSLTSAAGLSTVEVSGAHRYARGGKLIEPENVFAAVDEIFERMGDPSLPDQTFSEFLAHVEGSREAKPLAKAYVEGFNAARADRVSVHALAGEMQAADAIDGDRSFRVKQGYYRVAEQLWKECEAANTSLRIEAIATAVNWRRGAVEVAAQTLSGGLLAPAAGGCAVITLPLGVLQAPENAPGAVRFIPPVAQLRSALDRLAMGHAVRITLSFRDAFWQAQPQLSRPGFIHSHEKNFPTWWTTLSPFVPALTGWAGGPKAEAVMDLNDAALAECAIESLARILGISFHNVQDEVQSYWIHNWSRDPLTRGAYSYACVGGVEARRALAMPVEGTLFFAGEAAEVGGHGGTVHGAIASGQLAAEMILKTPRMQKH